MDLKDANHILEVIAHFHGINTGMDVNFMAILSEELISSDVSTEAGYASMKRPFVDT
jgi:hypothetical protein